MIRSAVILNGERALLPGMEPSLYGLQQGIHQVRGGVFFACPPSGKKGGCSTASNTEKKEEIISAIIRELFYSRRQKSSAIISIMKLCMISQYHDESRNTEVLDMVIVAGLKICNSAKINDLICLGRVVERSDFICHDTNWIMRLVLNACSSHKRY